jgi:hypothetical protein
MTDNLRVWALRLRAGWMDALLSMRSGMFGTSELRNGRRVDTTIETIARQKINLLELNAAIVRHDEELKESHTPGTEERHLR